MDANSFKKIMQTGKGTDLLLNKKRKGVGVGVHIPPLRGISPRFSLSLRIRGSQTSAATRAPSCEAPSRPCQKH